MEAAYKRQLDSAPTPAARDKMMRDLLVQFEDVRDPLRTAGNFGIEEIIDPRNTRPLACEVRTRHRDTHLDSTDPGLQWITHAYTHLLPPRLVAIQASAAAKPRKYKL